MTKVDIYSGFLGAGKTTLIKKMIAEGYKGQKLVLIENEFGEIGIDGGFLQDAGINITEMNSGCICCSLVGDFGKALTKVINEYHPDRIIIEPSGVGKLSDVIGAVNKVTGPDVTLGYTVAVVDAGKVKVYTKNFGEFYNNQVETASTIILSRTDSIPQAKLDAAVEILRQHNSVATVITTPWGELTGEQLISAMEGKASLAAELARLESERLEAEEDAHEHHHHHHDDEDDEDAHHHHHDDDDDEDAHEHHHHHHDDDDHCCCHDHDHEEHEHHHDHDHEEHAHHHHDHEHDENCTCGCHDHHHHHHHADEVFTSWGTETARKFEKQTVENALKALDSGDYGAILRAKGILPAVDGTWIHFDYVPEEHNVRSGSADVTGKLCVIGSKLDEKGIAELFGV
ncbi:GTP-binding protein [Pseudoflavonifractor sp. MSJ-30]|uniref:CobW family GTP-binding protein n=1 Tax=Pseudoflavonifractor sp. MSJ-30 TaxID=2841525 RepID=UPI001C110A97|nr:GTP-binding protein [Pseudoflavonifractor sp. MSJ-30]MBU5452043.1 GTP-binding protein [Pseudoflavonifractor sp. MSJ-30]